MTGLEALNKIDNEVLYGVYAQEHYSNELSTIRKELKALEIIKEKCVDVFRINYYITSNRIIELEEYKRDRKLTDEELELLKEVLE